MRYPRPYVIRLGLGRVCAAGQHKPCPAVGDPFDDEGLASGEVWACSCRCHWPPEATRPPAPEGWQPEG